MKIHVISDKCQGHNRCYALAPELFDVDDPRTLNLTTVPALLEQRPDPWTEIDDVHHSIQTLLDWYDRDEENGLGEMPYPPDYPKMPGEPRRVQPSRKKTE